MEKERNKRKIGIAIAIVSGAIVLALLLFLGYGKKDTETGNASITDLPIVTQSVPAKTPVPTQTPVPTPTQKPAPKEPDGWAIVISNELRVRTEKNTDCEVLEMATFGMEYEWIRDLSTDEWVAIRYQENITAYLAAEYVEIRENTGTPDLTGEPEISPAEGGTPSPTAEVTAELTPTEKLSPTATPTKAPTKAPTKKPTATPTKAPTKAPTKKPTATPTKAPTKAPTKKPTATPTKKPTATPTKKPTATPTPTPAGTNWLPADAKDEDMLTVLIYTEAGWPSDRDVQYQEMVAIGRVVINRVRSSRWENTIYDVIHEKNQFSVVKSGTLLKHYNIWMEKSYLSGYAAWRYEMANQAAKDVLTNGTWDFDYQFFRDSRGYEDYYQKSVIIGQTVFHNGVKK